MAASGKEWGVLDCPICLETLRDPKCLPCLHTFCELCIQSFIDSSITDCVQKKKTISFDCPVCRLVIPSPAKNVSAKEWTAQQSDVSNVEKTFVRLVLNLFTKGLRHLDCTHLSTYDQQMQKLTLQLTLEIVWFTQTNQ